MSVRVSAAELCPQGHASRTSLATRKASESAPAAGAITEEGGEADSETDAPLLIGSLDGRIVLLDVEAKHSLLVTQMKVKLLVYCLFLNQSCFSLMWEKSRLGAGLSDQRVQLDEQQHVCGRHTAWRV